jgi:inorganic pyrophosphatase
MNPYHIEPRDPDTGTVRVVIDTPAGSRNKYKFDASTGLFTIARVLPAGMAFPHDFGSVPGTRAEDGDPLDVLVIGPAPTFTGCLVEVRLLGMLTATQEERGKRIRNDRLLGVLVTPVNQPQLRSIAGLPSEHLRDIQEFFVSYNRAQGRTFRVTGHAGPREAQLALKRAERRYIVAAEDPER